MTDGEALASTGSDRVVLACDFFRVDWAVTLRRLYVFFVIEVLWAGVALWRDRAGLTPASCSAVDWL